MYKDFELELVPEFLESQIEELHAFFFFLQVCA